MFLLVFCMRMHKIKSKFHPIVSISLHPMNEKDIHWQNRSKRDHNNIYHGEKASLVYLAKYFTIVKKCITKNKNKNFNFVIYISKV
jgi:hypothetical protein